MKFSALALLACSMLAESSVAAQVNLRSSSDLQKCFEDCGKDASKDGRYKSSDIEECENECLDDEVAASGRTRSSIGPTGGDDLVSCSVDCGGDAEKKYKKELKNAEDDSCEKGCDKDDKECKKACDKENKDNVKKAERDAEKAGEKEFTKCNEKCFKGRSFISFDFAAAVKPFLRADSLEDCFLKCGDGKDAGDANKIKKCQEDCTSGTARANDSALMDCGSDCAKKAEDKYDKEMKDADAKDCEKDCGDDDEQCEKDCKDEEKKAESDAEKKAEDEYEKCTKECFVGDSLFPFNFAAAIKPFVRADDTVQECYKKCGDKDAGDAKKVTKCQDECTAGTVRANDEALRQCGANCADDAEHKYDKEMKDSDSKKCVKDCDEGDDSCEKSCKEDEKKAEREAEKKAGQEYDKCTDECFGGRSAFKLGYVA